MVAAVTIRVKPDSRRCTLRLATALRRDREMAEIGCTKAGRLRTRLSLRPTRICRRAEHLAADVRRRRTTFVAARLTSAE